MKHSLLVLFSFFFMLTVYSQKKAVNFYSYLQNIIKHDLPDNDSLVLDQYSAECSSCSWVISIIGNKDNCIVHFRPSTFGDGYADLAYSYTAPKDSIIASIEDEKTFLKGKNFKPKYSASLVVFYRNKKTAFKLPYLAGVFYRFRFVKSAVKVSD